MAVRRFSNPALRLARTGFGRPALLENQINSVFKELGDELTSLPTRIFSSRNPFKEIDKIFEDFPRHSIQTRASLACDFVEKEKEYEMHVDIPGVKKEDVKLSLDHQNNLLSVSAERKMEFEQKDESRCVFERSYGTMSRTIGLPDDVDLDNISAAYENGVLKVRIPKTEHKESEQIKQIEIQ